MTSTYILTITIVTVLKCSTCSIVYRIFNYISCTKIWIIGHRPHWTESNLLCMNRWPISENVEVNKADRYNEPSCIKMLPDVGMVKMYPKCVLKAANVDWVVTQSLNTPPCSWTFFISWSFHAATSGIRDTVHHPYISTCFCGKHFYAPCFFTFYGAQAAWRHVSTGHVHTSLH